MKSVYWIKTDLRVRDNTALNTLMNSREPVFAFWCPSSSFKRAHSFRKNFILENLLSLKTSFSDMGLEFLIFKASLPEVLAAWPRLVDYQVIYTQEYCPEEIFEQSLVSKKFSHSISVDQNSLIDLASLPFSINQLPEVFTQFRKRIESEVKLLQLDGDGLLNLSTPLEAGSSDPALETFKTWQQYSESDLTSSSHPLIRGGEAQGLKRLQEYIWDLDRLRVYKETRNGMLNWEDSSKLSPWLSVGSLSPKRIYTEIKRYESERIQNDSTYWLFFELLWRDYFRFISLKKGSKIFSQKNSNQKLSQKLESELFQRWKTGTTDNDFINANMREINQTGWMSNRGRQNVASYLAKTLHVNWILGAQYFESLLVDYDASSNWGNWSYVAGVGQDPRDRKFNPDLQASIYDPEGLYRKAWLT